MFKFLSAAVLTLGIAAAAVLGVTTGATDHAAASATPSKIHVAMLVR